MKKDDIEKVLRGLPSAKIKYLQRWMEETSFRKLPSAAFDYAALEAEHIKLRGRNTPAFRAIYHGSLEMFVDFCIEIIQDLRAKVDDDEENPSATRFRMHYPSEREMKANIMGTYRSRHWLDYFPERDKNEEHWKEAFQDVAIRCKQAYGWDDDLDDDGNEKPKTKPKKK